MDEAFEGLDLFADTAVGDVRDPFRREAHVHGYAFLSPPSPPVVFSATRG